MKRTKRLDEETIIDSDVFIERMIIIGLITDNEYTTTVLSWENINVRELLGSKTAGMIANWCIDHFEKYKDTVGMDMAMKFMEKTGNMNEADKLEIEDLLERLSDESIKQPMSPYRVDE